MLRLCLALAAACVAVSSATAGPIPWDYAVEVKPLGPLPLWAQIQPDAGGAVAGVHGVPDTISLVSIEPTRRGLRIAPFRTELTITDGNSGDTGTFDLLAVAYQPLRGGRVNVFTPQDGNDFLALLFGTGASGPFQTSFTQKIGQTTYTVEVDGYQDANGVGRLDAIVTAETPEPATLLLAAGGLAGVAGLRLRRRA